MQLQPIALNSVGLRWEGDLTQGIHAYFVALGAVRRNTWICAAYISHFGILHNKMLVDIIVVNVFGWGF